MKMRHVMGSVGVLALMVGCATAVLAGVPDVPDVTIRPEGPIPVTVLRPDGTPDPGHPSPAGALYTGPTARTVTVRDLAGGPVPGMLVRVSFADCCDIELCSVTGQPGVSVVAGAHSIEGFTNDDGQFTFTVVGAAQNVEDGMAPTQDGCGGQSDPTNVKVIVSDGSTTIVTLKRSAYVFNQDGGAVGGSAAVTAQDAGRVLQDVFSFSFGGTYRGRSDLNGNGAITAADAGIMLQEALRLGAVGAQASTACGAAPLVERPPTCP